MAKDDPKTRPKNKGETPFQKFEQMTRRLVAVPKERVDEQKRKWKQRHPQ